MDMKPHLSCRWTKALSWDAVNPNQHVPDEPGFYIFTNYPGELQPPTGQKQILYIGVAAQSLRRRIRKHKSGDVSGTRGLMNAQAGAFFLTLSRSTGPANPTLEPQSIYLRWAVDYRAAIESLLIKQFKPRFNNIPPQD